MSAHQRYLVKYQKTMDGKTTGTTTLFTTDNGTERFYPIITIFEITNGSAILSVGTISVGTNSATYNNIQAAAALTGLTATNNIIMFNSALSAISSVAANTAVLSNITVGFTATTATLKVTIIGFYE